ncbi:MAG TPA: D-aminoacylase [Gammaproteobacteria bacterium]|nr:D-aminoacylase [Gammaproteobacteria bacterium]HIF86050.1 D-aminoacylase [Gammaproteobacteria bacterium]HIL61885.1 D-aminoacylase [Porticoccaceae bacterium]
MNGMRLSMCRRTMPCIYPRQSAFESGDTESIMKVTQILLLLSVVAFGNALAQDNYDIIIRGGKIIDGSGNPWYEADVGITDERVTAIGNLSPDSATTLIDATGLIVAPGFIDPHTHAIRGIFDVPTAESALLQGVTTLTEGNDGSSPFPIDAHYQAIIEKQISPNWAVFVGQGTIRSIVIGSEDRAATPAEMQRMQDMIAQAMEQGALGISTGLFYVPGSFTPTSEVIELSKVAAAYGGIYISHMREEAAQLIDSVQETIRIGVEANIPVQMTHHKVIGKGNYGASVDSLRLVDEARARGIDISIDQYPYTASQTGIVALIPQWAQEGGNERLLERIASPETRGTVKAAIVDKILYDRGGGDPKNVVISRNPRDRSMEGKNLAELTLEAGMSPTPENAADVVMDIVKAGGATAVYHAIGPEDVDRIMQHPATAIGSDGPLSVFGVGAPHPRQYGTFARVLGHFVRERGVITLEDAIRKMSSLTAQRLGIRDRGLLAENYYADIAVFDADEIIDMATFEEPHQYAVGMKYVLVNGQLVVEDGQHTGRRPGKILYGPGYTGR